MPTRVDVDRNESFGFINDDVAAALEMDLSAEGGFQLPGDAEAIEDGLMIAVELDLVGRTPGDLGDPRRSS